MVTVEELDKRLKKIEERNSRVEVDKAWEISWFRRILIAIFTYLAIAIYLAFIVHIDPWINAIIPSLDFLLLTLTLPLFKKIWKRYNL